MFFALSLLLVFFILGLLVYKGELFNASNHDDYSSKDDLNINEYQTEKSFFLSEELKKSSNQYLLKKN
ncbi:hypothetical protein [uncultured Algibacter sp.]|uniref:hypothetical protein n=1 Tax=uncultured Algibacter sp. TaxID=298659 RepID=UPI002633C284|nr:hypothetical protein [uncultured Algibacter sp.]